MTLGFDRRQEWSAALSPESFRGGAASLRLLRSFPVAVAFSFIAASVRRNLEVCNNIADNLNKAGWSLGYVSAIDSHERTIWIADAHCDDGKRFVVRAEENLSIAKALPKERQPRHGAIATSTYWLQCLTRVIYQAFSCTPHHRIVSYDNEFTVKWRRWFRWNKRS